MLQFQELTIVKGDRIICKEISLTVGKGTVMLVEGPHASGKSTMLMSILGHKPPKTGRILLDGYDIHQLTKQQRKLFLESTGIVLQDISLRPYDTAEGDVLIKDLSQGEKRSLDLHRALRNEPRLLLLDEPFLGLQGDQKEQCKKMFFDMKRLGKTFLIFTSTPEEFQFLNPEKILTLTS